jgi:selenocysteine-specific elongation factor
MPHIVVGTAGHIDHGKSSLVLALTGTDPDRLKEEKERGITIELGFAHAAIGDVTVAFVDVPGHERFVRTMLAGAGGLDAVMLVVAADESVMPQTREHFEICRLLRVGRGIVVLTKSDLVDQDTLDLVRLEVRELVAGSFLADASVLPVSARTGAGLDELRAVLAGYGRAVEHRRRDGAARLPIDRAFSIQGFGTVVTGTLVSGRIRPDDELELVPGGQRVRVRGVQVHARGTAEAVTGQRTAVNLGGIEVAAIHRGQSLCAPDGVTVTRRADVVIELLPGAKPLKHGARVHVHQGTMEVLGRVSIAGSMTEMTPGSSAPARLRLEAPAALTRGDRFILRAYSPTITIGGGEILDPDPPRVGIRIAAAAARFAAIGPAPEGHDDSLALTRMVRDAGGAGLPVRSLIARAGVTPGTLDAAVSTLTGSGAVRIAGSRLVSADIVEGLSSRLLALVADFHKAQPLADGIPREEARERVFARAHIDVFILTLQDLAESKRLVVRDRLALPGHRLELSAIEQQAFDGIEAAYSKGGLKPPDPATIAVDGKWPLALVEKMTTLLIRQTRLTRVDTLIFHSQALADLKSETRALKASGHARVTVDVSTFKERYGVTRKFAIPLLEWLDRERVTRRVGDARVVL